MKPLLATLPAFASTAVFAADHPVTSRGEHQAAGVSRPAPLHLSCLPGLDVFSSRP